MKRPDARALSAVLVVCALTLPVAAHVEAGEAGGLLTGFLHPVSGLDHVVAMLAVGLWGAQLGAPALWVLPVFFPMVMALGGMLALVGLPVPGVEIGIALSGLALGLFVALEVRAPLPVAVALVGLFAIFHGHAHGTELPEGQSGLLYSIGFVVSTGLLHGAGITIGLAHRWRWGQRALRVTGGLIAAVGAWFLWSALS